MSPPGKAEKPPSRWLLNVEFSVSGFRFGRIPDKLPRKVNGLLRHIVMWKLKEHAEGASRAENAVKLKATLETCRSIVSGQGHFEVGIAQLGFDATCDVILVSDFDDKAALDAYQVHPRHVAIKPFVAAVRESRQCIDYEV
jgi:hypothetical protein